MRKKRAFTKFFIDIWSDYDSITKIKLLSASLIVTITISLVAMQYVKVNSYQGQSYWNNYRIINIIQNSLTNNTNNSYNVNVAGEDNDDKVVEGDLSSSNTSVDNNTPITNNGQNENVMAEQKTTEPDDVLPEISEEDVRTVDFKLFKLNGKVDIVDIKGHTYIDIESLASWFGRSLGWDYENDRFICILFGADFRGGSLEEEIYINGRSTKLAKPIYIIDKVPYIPAESFAENVGAEIVLEGDKMEIRVRNMAKAAYTFLRS